MTISLSLTLTLTPTLTLTRTLTRYAKNADLYYATLAADPALLLPVGIRATFTRTSYIRTSYPYPLTRAQVAYTPTVGEACQKFGKMPFYSRGCYVSIQDRGNVKAVLQEYAEAMLPKKADGSYDCQCIVFSDGGRILGLGDRVRVRVRVRHPRAG